MKETSIANHLHPSHYNDLRKSGLSDDVIRANGFYSVRPSDISKKLGWNGQGIESLLAIPYPGCNGFERYKPFHESDQGKKPKYLQKKDSGNHLYIPETVQAILQDTTAPLYITEGEKKSSKGCQEGLYCIGLSGLWNYKNKNSDDLISDFDRIAFKDRTVHIIPDNDWQKPNKHGYKKNLEQAVYGLTYKLKDRGARVSIVQIPEGGETWDNNMKTGLDDYLIAHSIEDFKLLPVIEALSIPEKIDRLPAVPSDKEVKAIIEEIANVNSEFMRETYFNKLKAKTGVRKESLRNEVSKIRDLLNPFMGNFEDKEKIVFCANFPGLIDIVLNDDGNVAYLIQSKNGLKIIKEFKTDGGNVIPPGKEHLPFQLIQAKNVIKRYSKEDKTLFADVLTYLKRFSYQEDQYWLIIALKVFLTYLQDHKDIQYIAMILFHASPERGKSRTGKAMITISYRGIHVVDLREANLFRYSQDLQATIFFDLMNMWQKAERNGSEDILLLRFEKGAQVARVLFPDKGAFQDTKYYSVYGATIIATNESLHHILDTRCIPIAIPNRPGNYENPTPDKGTELKERLTAWRAKMMDISLPEVEQVQGLQGRLWDISRPLLQICKVVASEYYTELVGVLLEIAGARVEDKKSTIEGQVVTIIEELSPTGLTEWEIKVSDILAKLNAKRPNDKQLTSQYVGRKLKTMGFQRRITDGHSVIKIKEKELINFQSQYTATTFTKFTKPTKPNNINDIYSVKDSESAATFTNIHCHKPTDIKGNNGLSESSESCDRDMGASSGKLFSDGFIPEIVDLDSELWEM